MVLSSKRTMTNLYQLTALMNSNKIVRKKSRTFVRLNLRLLWSVMNNLPGLIYAYHLAATVGSNR